MKKKCKMFLANQNLEREHLGELEEEINEWLEENQSIKIINFSVTPPTEHNCVWLVTIFYSI